MNIAFFSPVEFYERRRQTGTFELTIVNMMSFQIHEDADGNEIKGTIVAGPGDIVGGGAPPGGAASMISAIRLIR